MFWAEKQAVNYVTAKTPGRRPDWEASGSPTNTATAQPMASIGPSAHPQNGGREGR